MVDDVEMLRGKLMPVDIRAVGSLGQRAVLSHRATGLDHNQQKQQKCWANVHCLRVERGKNTLTGRFYNIFWTNRFELWCSNWT
jgi:hypothetical protein